MRKWIRAWKKGRKRQYDASESRERGQSIVEMAFAFPILLMLLIAVIDFARVFDASIVLTNAVREGARFASKDRSLTQADVQAIVVSDVAGSGTNITMMADFDESNVTVLLGYDDVSVTAAYDFGLWFGGIIGLHTVHLEREAVMPCF